MALEVIGFAAMSLDGCTTRHDKEGTGFVSWGDREFFRRALAECDCSLMGARTFEAAKELIVRNLEENRLRLVLTSEPQRYAKYARPGRLEFRSGDLGRIIAELDDRGLKRCALLGGTAIYTEAVARGLLTELWITLEPVGFGTGRRLFEGRNDFRFELRSVERLPGSSVLLKYRLRAR